MSALNCWENPALALRGCEQENQLVLHFLMWSRRIYRLIDYMFSLTSVGMPPPSSTIGSSFVFAQSVHPVPRENRSRHVSNRYRNKRTTDQSLAHYRTTPSPAICNSRLFIVRVAIIPQNVPSSGGDPAPPNSADNPSAAAPVQSGDNGGHAVDAEGDGMDTSG